MLEFGWLVVYCVWFDVGVCGVAVTVYGGFGG